MVEHKKGAERAKLVEGLFDVELVKDGRPVRQPHKSNLHADALC